MCTYTSSGAFQALTAFVCPILSTYLYQFARHSTMLCVYLCIPKRGLDCSKYSDPRSLAFNLFLLLYFPYAATQPLLHLHTCDPRRSLRIPQHTRSLSQVRRNLQRVSALSTREGGENLQCSGDMNAAIHADDERATRANDGHLFTKIVVRRIKFVTWAKTTTAA